MSERDTADTIARHVYEALRATKQSLGYDASRYAFLNVLDGYFGKRNSVSDISAVASSLIFELNDPKHAQEQWPGGLAGLLIYATEIDYYQAKAAEGKEKAIMRFEKIQADLKTYYEENSDLIE